MYKVIVVDDEPIILSGIRHLIDWGEVNAEIAGCAANGAEAYAMIRSIHPDIVITDIRMPVMDGLSLAGRCSEEFPDIVFVILTSLAEFSLAKEAIGYGVTDYLLKTELDAGSLRSVMLHAEEERSRRRGNGAEPENSGGTEKAASAVSTLLVMRDISRETASLLEEHGLLSGFAFIAFAFDFPLPSLEKQWNAGDYNKLHDWERDIVEKILSSSFASFYPVMPVAGKAGILSYFVSGLSSDTWSAQASRLEAKVASASSMVTGLSPVLLRTAAMDGRDSLKEARRSIERQMMAYYLAKDEADLSPQSLDIDAVFLRLEAGIAARDPVSCRTCFAVIRDAVTSADHSLAQFGFLTAALRSAVSSGLSAIGMYDSSSVLDAWEAADFITRRSGSISFIDDVGSGLLMLLDSTVGTGGDVADKAREYVLTHVSEKITLGDVAAYACVSPGYMSKIFKRVMGMSLVDYISSVKVAKAKEMMERSPEMRVSDIALALGFHNIYYFSKVFRKIEGVPPTEWKSEER